MDWNLRSKVLPVDADELIEVLLANRQITDEELFLNPKHPLDITALEVGLKKIEIKKALKRLESAKANKEKVIVFGDYDCDGVCATAILWETLYEDGFSVFPFIPDRTLHGYGLSTKALDALLKEGKPAVVISVDNGIVAHTQWQRLRDEGIYTILTDHHEPDAARPPVDALIHTTSLCGATVAWMLARELNPQKAALMLDLCALATIADQVQLTGANRSFAKTGLEQLRQTKRLGLKLIMETAGLKEGNISPRDVSFGIVPRINAMGRLGSALDALRAICTRSEVRARQLVQTLQSTNLERQDLTSNLVELARSRAQLWKEENIIVVADKSFHEGVIGLIAGKLTEEFHKPSIVISLGEKTSKASGRSIAGVHLTNLLRLVSADLLEVGGHPMAAGLKLETSKLSAFTQHIQILAREQIHAELLNPTVDVDCKLPAVLLTIQTANDLRVLEPYGAGNKEPLFLLESMLVTSSRSIGKEGKHLKLTLQFQTDQQASIIEAIGFGLGERQIDKGSTINCIGAVQINEWKGSSTLQLRLVDLVTVP